MKWPIKNRKGLMIFILANWFATTIFAHTLPISYLTLVPDGNYLHLELTLNPFELNVSPKFNGDKNLLAESGDRSLSDSILQHIKIKADGKLLSAETAGLSIEDENNHLTLRAHYHVANLQAAISIASDLNSITSASHLTEVTFGQGGQSQLARLDSQTQIASFAIEIPQSEVTISTDRDQITVGYFVILLLAAIPIIGVLVLLSTFALKHLREQPQH